MGNIDEEADEDDNKSLFGVVDMKITLKEKERKRAKVRCNEQENCRYGRECKWIHMNELDESALYAIIEVK